MTHAPEILIHHRCRVCLQPLHEVLNLGALRLNTFPAHLWEIPQIPQVPLILTVCGSCGLVQLDRTVPPDWMYRTYWYRSAVNETMVQELRNIVEQAVSLVPVGGGDAVLDIGANDGTLLQQYAEIGRSPWRTAVEPALNLQEVLDRHCEELVTAYWPTGVEQRTFRIITAIACCYDTEAPVAFFEGIRQHLAPDGVCIVQFQDLGQMLEAAAFDNICHEHLEYYTLHSLIHVLEQVGLGVQSCQQTSINGGSLRVVIRHLGPRRSWLTEASVFDQLTHEEGQQLSRAGLQRGLTALDRFRRRVTTVQTQIQAVLDHVAENGSVVDVYGASTKGNILLQVLNIGPERIRRAIDRSPAKEGCYTLTGIPIVSEQVGMQEAADVWLCPIWQFRESVLRRNQAFLQGGGQIIFPLPACEIVKESWMPPVAREVL